MSGTVTHTDSTLIFTPDQALNPNTVYTATITSGAKNTIGIPLAGNYVWSFTTVAIVPTVISTDPLNNATGVAVEPLYETVPATGVEPCFKVNVDVVIVV